jgi:hypothetical protein
VSPSLCGYFAFEVSDLSHTEKVQTVFPELSRHVFGNFVIINVRILIVISAGGLFDARTWLREEFLKRPLRIDLAELNR